MNDEMVHAFTGIHESTSGRFWIHRVVGYYDVITHTLLPFSGFTLKVVETGPGEYRSVPNVFVYNSATECIEYTCGLGASIEIAVKDAIEMFMSEVIKQKANKPTQNLDESDFVWLNWQPYVQLTMPPTS